MGTQCHHVAPWPGSHTGDFPGHKVDRWRSPLLCHCIRRRKGRSPCPPSSSPASPFYPSKSEFPVAAGSPPSVCWVLLRCTSVLTRPCRSSCGLQRHRSATMSSPASRVMNYVSLQAALPEFYPSACLKHTAQEKQKPLTCYLFFLNSFLGAAEELELKYFKNPT